MSLENMKGQRKDECSSRMVEIISVESNLLKKTLNLNLNEERLKRDMHSLDRSFKDATASF